jgi:hypothetical protein
MRRFAFLASVLAVVVLGAPSAWALEESRVLSRVEQPAPAAVRFAAHTGLAFGNAAISTGLASDNRLAFTVGVSAEAALVGRFLSFQPELNLVPKGGRNAHFGVNGLTTLTYLELPMLLKAQFSMRQIRPFLVGGFGLGYLVGRGAPAGAVANLRPLDVTAHLGLGAAFRLSEEDVASAVSVAVRYSAGLVDADAGPNSWYSQSYSLLVGFQL